MTSRLKDPHTLRIFISSPFNGMELERERLSRLHWPRLESALAAKGIQLRTVDMRWGITSESSSDSQVISICLRELDRSDIFVGFFGQRYGWHGAEDKALQENFDKAQEQFSWVNDYRDRSVTELEFLHGHLNHPGQLPAIICFRDKAWDDARRAEGVAQDNKRTIYKFSPESDHSTILMDGLKKRVEETEEQTLGINMTYHHPDECADFIFDNLWGYLKKTLLSDDVTAPTERENEAVAHVAFMNTRRGLYISAEHAYEQLDRHVGEDAGCRTMVITGEAGIGKSALISNWIAKREQSSSTKKEQVVYHFIGADKASTDVDSMLVRVLSEINHHVFRETYSRPSVKDSSELAQQMAACLQRVGEKHADVTLVIVIDGLDKLASSGKTSKPLFWLPRLLPANIRVILTLTPGQTNADELIETLQGDYDVTSVECPSLTADQKRKVCDELLKLNSKSLSPEQLDLLVQSERAAHPLYLRVVIEELCVYGSFRQLTKQIDRLLSCDGIVGLLNVVVERLEKDYDHPDYEGNVVEEILCAICLCKHGMAEGDLPVPQYMWAPLYHSMHKYLISRAGLLGFAFDEMHKVVRERYMDSPEKRKLALSRVIEIFHQPYKAAVKNQKPLSEGCVIELAYLLHQGDDVRALIDVIGDVTVFDILYRRERFALLEYWQFTKVSSDAIARRYMHNLDLAVLDFYLNRVEAYENKSLDESSTTWKLRILKSLNEWFITCKLFKGMEIITQRLIDFEGRRPYHDENRRGLIIANINYSLACHYCETDRYTEAIQLHEKVLHTYKRFLESGEVTNGLLGNCYHGLGTCYYYLRQHDKAEEMFLKSRELQLDDPEYRIAVADSLCNLANIYSDRGELNKTVENLLKAIEIREQEETALLTIGMAYLYHNLGLAYRRMNNLDQAEVYYIKSLKVKERVLGNASLDIGYTLLNLGALKGYQGDLENSLSYYQRALGVFKLTAQEQPHIILMAQENVACGLTKLMRFEEAEPIYLQAYEKLMKTEDKLARGLPPLHREMVNYYARQENWEKAGEICVALIESGIGEERDYGILDMADGNMPEQPQRPQAVSIDSGVIRFPESPMLLKIKLMQILNDGPDALTSFIGGHCEAQTEQEVRGKRHLISGAVLTASLGAHQVAVQVLEAGRLYAPDNEEIVNILEEAKSNLEKANQPTS